MPKTIAITPSHYWPRGVPRTVGIPPFLLTQLAVERWARRAPDAQLIGGDSRTISAGTLASTVRAAAIALRGRVPEGSRIVISAGASSEGAVLVLAALASGRQTVLVVPGTKTASAASAAGVTLAASDPHGLSELSTAGIPALRLDELLGGDLPPADQGSRTERDGYSEDATRKPIAGFPVGDRVAWHSHRSLLSHALSMRAFFAGAGGIDPHVNGTGGSPADAVISTLSPCSWPGLAVLAFALLAGNTWIGCEMDDRFAERLSSDQPAWLATPLAEAALSLPAGGRRARKERSVRSGALLTIDGPFDPDGPIAVGRALGCPALSLFGMPETGPVLASHPSWYLVESAGIPLPNVHLVPTDPRSGEPISTLWELVDAAAMKVWSPSVMLGYDAGTATDAGTGRTFATGKLAAADPNGMLYLLDG